MCHSFNCFANQIPSLFPNTHTNFMVFLRNNFIVKRTVLNYYLLKTLNNYLLNYYLRPVNCFIFRTKPRLHSYLLGSSCPSFFQVATVSGPLLCDTSLTLPLNSPRCWGDLRTEPGALTSALTRWVTSIQRHLSLFTCQILTWALTKLWSSVFYVPPRFWNPCLMTIL